MKGKFKKEQETVRIIDIGNSKYNVFICLNGEEKTEINEDNVAESYIEYDYNEFIATADKIEDINANPEKYINYVVEKEKTAEEIIAKLKEELAATQAAVDYILFGGDLNGWVFGYED